jgi:hypothetical protein
VLAAETEKALNAQLKPSAPPPVRSRSKRRRRRRRQRAGTRGTGDKISELGGPIGVDGVPPEAGDDAGAPAAASSAGGGAVTLSEFVCSVEGQRWVEWAVRETVEGRDRCVDPASQPASRSPLPPHTSQSVSRSEWGLFPSGAPAGGVRF